MLGTLRLLLHSLETDDMIHNEWAFIQSSPLYVALISRGRLFVYEDYEDLHALLSYDLNCRLFQRPPACTFDLQIHVRRSLQISVMFQLSFFACLLRLLVLGILVLTSPKPVTTSLGTDIARYAVHSLPNICFSLPPSWAGQIPVPGVSNDELFFWLFEAEGHYASSNFISKNFY